MTAFVLTWKDTVWPYERLCKLIEAFRRDGHVDALWRVAAHQAAQPGDLAFLLKQGKEPRGIFGFGRLLDRPSMRLDPDDPGEPRMQAKVRFESLSDPVAEPLLIPLHELRGVLPDWQINAQASGQAALPEDAKAWLLRRLGSQERPADEALGGTPLRSSPTKGPVPTSWTGIVERDSSGPAHTYAFQFGTRPVWKIGYTRDVKGRLAEVNRHIPHEEIKEHWRHAFHQPWANSKLAHEMEQKVLKSLEHYRSDGERVRCPEQTVREAWAYAVLAVRRLASQL